jgi:hypothetical protein
MKTSFFTGVMLLAVALPLAADDTPPVISYSVAGTEGENGWYTSDVALSWTVSDDESAVTTSGCEATTITQDQPMTTYTCVATSDGGTSSVSVDIGRDTTAPVITFEGNAGTYTVDQSVTITCTASDATSGVASTDCTNIDLPAYSFNPGTTQYTFIATDAAGNSGTTTLTFTVVVDLPGVQALIDRFVSKASVARRLNNQLEAGHLDQFNRTLDRETGKSISQENADLIRYLVAFL